MPNDDLDLDPSARSDGPVAAYVHVLCEGCNTYLPGEQNGRRNCSRCNVTVAVRCDVETIETEPA
jgi:hypothetical protein